jgi:hypothetical protein
VRYDFFSHGGKVREDGRMVHDMYLMRIKKPEESKQKFPQADCTEGGQNKRWE